MTRNSGWLPQDAEASLAPYIQHTTNPYTIYEQSQVAMNKAEHYTQQGSQTIALEAIIEVISMIEVFQTRYELPNELKDVFQKALGKKVDLEGSLNI